MFVPALKLLSADIFVGLDEIYLRRSYYPRMLTHIDVIIGELYTVYGGADVRVGKNET